MVIVENKILFFKWAEFSNGFLWAFLFDKSRKWYDYIMSQAGFEPGAEQDCCHWRLQSCCSNHLTTTAGCILKHYLLKGVGYVGLNAYYMPFALAVACEVAHEWIASIIFDNKAQCLKFVCFYSQSRSTAHRTSSLPKEQKEKCPLTSVNLSIALTSDQVRKARTFR